jgi:hypothetical protein
LIESFAAASLTVKIAKAGRGRVKNIAGFELVNFFEKKTPATTG